MPGATVAVEPWRGGAEGVGERCQTDVTLPAERLMSGSAAPALTPHPTLPNRLTDMLAETLADRPTETLADRLTETLADMLASVLQDDVCCVRRFSRMMCVVCVGSPG